MEEEEEEATTWEGVEFESHQNQWTMALEPKDEAVGRES